MKKLLSIFVLTLIGCCGTETESEKVDSVSTDNSATVAPVFTGLYTWDVLVQHYSDALCDDPLFETTIRVQADSGIQAELRALDLAKRMHQVDDSDGMWCMGPVYRVDLTESR